MADPALTLMLRQAIGDLVVVTFMGHEHIDRQSRIRRCIERAHGDAQVVLVDRVPEQRRSASAAETSPNLFRRLEPSQVILALNGYGGARNIARCKHMTRVLATLRAVTGIRRRQRTGDLKSNRAAETGTLMHNALLAFADQFARISTHVLT